MEENHHLLQPLLSTSTTNTSYSPHYTSAAAGATATTPPLDDHQESNNLKLISSNSGIVLRLSFVAFIGIVSMWAAHEDSKGFAISIVNEAGATFPGKQFQLFYVSNDEASRIVMKASELIEDFLYPESEGYTKKPVDSMILKLVNQNFTGNIKIVDSSKGGHYEYVLEISRSIMEGTDIRHAMLQALQQGVARIWLWDCQGNVPKHLINGMVEYIVSKIGGSITSQKVGPQGLATSCWNHEDSTIVVGFLDYWERRQPGFVRRLNQAMKQDWHDGTLDDVLGLPVQNLCTAYHESLRYNLSST